MRFTLPLFFGIQARAFNRLRKIYGLEPIRGRGAQEVFTRGNHTLYLDIPELYDLGPLSASESYIGPVNWAMDTPLPRWWKRLPADKPVVFVSPGSSGDTRGTLRILQTLAGTDVTLVVATAGRLDRDALPEDAFVADFIPAPDVVKRADLVICNGGCAMVYQALAQGKPVLGIPSNIDQYYTMEAIERKGAGKLIRAGMADPDAVRLAVDTILAEPSYRQAAGTLQTHIQKLDTVKLFSEAVERTVGGFGGATATADGEATAEEIASCPDFAVSNS